MVKGEVMNEGDHVKFKSRRDAEAYIPLLLKRLDSWDFSSPLVLKLQRCDPKSEGQNNLFHKWCGEMSSEFIGKVPDATKEGMKFMMKKMFLGTQTITVGKYVYPDQIMPLPTQKGEMYHFMEQVYHWAAKRDVLLSLPQYNEFTALKRKQEE